VAGRFRAITKPVGTDEIEVIQDSVTADAGGTPIQNIPPASWRLFVEAHADGATFVGGVAVTVRCGSGIGQVYELTLPPTHAGEAPKTVEWEGVGHSCEVSARAIATGETYKLLGGLTWTCEVASARRTVGRQSVVRKLIDHTIQTADGSAVAVAPLAALNPNADALHAAAGPLLGGGAMRPVVVRLFGLRWRDNVWEYLGAFVCHPALPRGEVTIRGLEGRYIGLGHMLSRFEVLGGGQCLFEVWATVRGQGG